VVSALANEKQIREEMRMVLAESPFPIVFMPRTLHRTAAVMLSLYPYEAREEGKLSFALQPEPGPLMAMTLLTPLQRKSLRR
jgi:hypothetical protein